MTALAIDNIRKSYGDVETLKGIDIALDSGEFLVLLGASGCGKSTLLNIIAGLAEPNAGDSDELPGTRPDSDESFDRRCTVMR